MIGILIALMGLTSAQLAVLGLLVATIVGVSAAWVIHEKTDK